MAQQVVSAPTLIAGGVRNNGHKVVMALDLLTDESAHAWGGLIARMGDCGLRRPRLVVIHGSQGLRVAAKVSGPGVAVRQCIGHKLRSLEEHVSRHPFEQARPDHHRIVHAESLRSAHHAYTTFIAKWYKQAPKVAVNRRRQETSR